MTCHFAPPVNPGPEAAALSEKLRAWADEQAARALPKLKFGEALGYLHNQ